jgi:hypothetical protein
VKFIKSVVPKARSQEYVLYLWLLALSILCYGIMIPLLGFYWDDIPYLYLYNTFGPSGYPEYVASDRPFSAWIFMLTTALFGNRAIGYHLLALVLRWISAVLFMKIIETLWPENKTFTFLAASIFLVYPGFLQQPIALIYNHHLSVLCLFLSSVLLMLKNATRHKPSGLLLLFSLVGSLHMFSIENFATLEIIRPLLIYTALKKKDSAAGQLKKSLFFWLPYLIVFLLFIAWRVFIFQFPTYQPGFIEQFADNPLGTLGLLSVRIPADFLTSTVGAWTDSLTIPTVSSFGKSATLMFWLLASFTFILTLLFTRQVQGMYAVPNSSSRQKWTVFGFGIILFFLAGSINWVLDLPLEIVFAWDRMTLAFIPAAAILIALLLSAFDQPTLIRNLLFSLIISAAVGSHFQNNMAYKRDWENFQDFLWQLSWRMPALEEDTTLLGSEIGLKYYSDNSLTPALNMIYRDDLDASWNLDYLFYYTEVRLGSGLPALERDLPINQSHRSYSFTGSTSDVVAIRFDPPACMHVMDRIYSNSVTNRNLSEMQAAELRLSNLERILPLPFHNPPEFLASGPPEKTWCYFFQKADLARQSGDYASIILLGDQAMREGLAPRIGSEWLPFLEGYIRTGRWNQAQHLAAEIYTLEGNYANGLCYTFERIRDELNTRDQNQIDKIIRDYNCR